MSRTDRPAAPPLLEESLDPADWDGLRRLGHQMLDDMLSTLLNSLYKRKMVLLLYFELI